MAISPTEGPAHGGTRVTIIGHRLAKNVMDVKTAKVGGVLASVVSVSPSKVVVKTGPGAAATDGGVVLETYSVGIIKSKGPTSTFRYSHGGQLVRVVPSQGSRKGGNEIILEGSRLCRHDDCQDLQYVRVGAAKVRRFLFKEPHRIVFLSPPASAAGAVSLHDVSVVSRVTGESVALASFEYLRGGSIGRANPHNAPLTGGTTVSIKGPNLGKGSEYNVMLAGVRAKVLSASPQELTVQAGDASKFANANKLGLHEGLDGTVVIEVKGDQGVMSGVDSLIGFHYNAKCRITSVASRRGPADGEVTLVVTGSHLGMGDEMVKVNGMITIDPGVIERRRDDANVEELRVRIAASRLDASGMPHHLKVSSSRTGNCEWKAPKAPTKKRVAEPAKARSDTPKSSKKVASAPRAKKLEPSVQEEISVKPIHLKKEDDVAAAKKYYTAAKKKVEANEVKQEIDAKRIATTQKDTAKAEIARQDGKAALNKLKKLTRVDHGIASFYP